ncbi:MAG: bifunctional diguanylate cyclase/phosphodiesterase [Sulfurimonas sp.]|jgi:diguanylate cyclase (GGDEF)-like protein|nr:bifunctional diguanylate cyclase/phosphodiesterase [Sulfurimonas sp.]
MNSNILEVNNFTLTSSRDIPSAIQKLENLKKENMLIHVVSFMHNTVLVQTLKSELVKIFPNIKIVLLTHNDKHSTCLTLYSLNKEVDPKSVHDEIIKELYLQGAKKELVIKEYRNKLFSRYFTDHLTNLPNTYRLRNDLDEYKHFALVVFNIDNFHTINNFYGHIVGDYVIEKVGKHLQDIISKQNIYKLAADEFALVIPQNIGFYELKEYLEELCKKIKNIVIEYQNINIYIDFTLGSATNRENKNIFSNVSMALKYAKDMGVKFWIYEDRMNFENQYERNLQLSAVVRYAVENSKIFPYFQAIVDSKTSEIKKYECLARLMDQNEKILSPALFIPVAKKIKVYNIITKTIIDKAFETFEDSEFEFSVNLSIEDIMSSEMFNFIMQKLKHSKASNRVIFELLESDAIEDFVKVERFISEVKRYGAKIAIDDFGSGYSNFKYLTKMSADYIKIDGSLVQNIDVDKNALFVVETIVDFARKLGIKTIAEYVHSSVILGIVKDLDIDYSQVFYIDEPSVSISKSI